jgi:hypothetical protein
MAGKSSTDPTDDAGASRPTGASSRRSLLASRTFVTWVELVVVGFAGSALGGAVSGPPQLVVYLATTLLSVGVLLYNVDRLLTARAG